MPGRDFGISRPRRGARFLRQHQDVAGDFSVHRGNPREIGFHQSRGRHAARAHGLGRLAQREAEQIGHVSDRWAGQDLRGDGARYEFAIGEFAVELATLDHDLAAQHGHARPDRHVPAVPG